MTRRLLLTGSILGALAGGGAAAQATHVVATATSRVQVIDAAGTHRPASAPVARTTPAAVPSPAAAHATVVAPADHSATRPSVVARLPQPPVARSAAAPVPQRNRLTGPHGLNTGVGPQYTDCTGTSAVPHDRAVIDACHTDAVLFVGHNPGVFTPLLRFSVGDVINWYDGAGAVHHLRIVAVRDVSSSVFPPVLGTYEFQTCRFTTPNSPLDRDLDAVEV